MVFVVVARGRADPRVPCVLKGMAAALILELSGCIYGNALRLAWFASGTMYHQNLLAMMVHFVDCLCSSLVADRTKA